MALSGFSSSLPNDPEALRECLADTRCYAVVSSRLTIDQSLFRHVLYGVNGTLNAGVLHTQTLLKTSTACAPPSAPPSPQPSAPPIAPPIASPSAPPMLITNKIGFVTLVQATVETFDGMAYRNRMATRLSLPVAQIEISVEPGSVIVATTVSVDSGATGVVDSIVELQADTAATTAMFGAPASIDVASIETTTLEPPAPPPDAPPSSSDVGVPWLWIGLAIGAAALMGIVVAMIIWSAPKPQYTTPPKEAPKPDATEALPEPRKISRQLSYGRRSGLAAQQQLLRPEEATPTAYWWLSL